VGRVTLSDEKYADLLLESEQNIGRLRATVFQPLDLQSRTRHRYFGRPSDCVILPESSSHSRSDSSVRAKSRL
jgi:hypothetical protein